MNDHLENKLASQTSGADFERVKYVPPTVRRQELPDVVCGASGRGDDLQSVYDPSDSPRPNNQPQP